jgi:vitamin B12 transporter
LRTNIILGTKRCLVVYLLLTSVDAHAEENTREQSRKTGDEGERPNRPKDVEIYSEEKPEEDTDYLGDAGVEDTSPAEEDSSARDEDTDGGEASVREDDEKTGPLAPSEASPSEAEATPEGEQPWREGMTKQSEDERMQDELSEKAVDLDMVTVVGTDEVKEIKESGYPITVIDPAKFAPRAMSVTELLERVPGVKVRRSGGLGSSTRISIRGLEGKRVKVYIDGAPLNAPDGSFAIDDIPLHVIERIEVYKGVVPAKFGGDGLGGAVNIVIVDLPPRYIDASYAVASYNQHKAHIIAKTYFEKPGIEWGIGLLGQFAENDYLMPLPPSLWDPDTGRTHARRDHDRYQEAILATSLHFKKLYFDDLELELVYMPNKKEIQGIPGFTGDAEAPVRNVQHARRWTHIWVVATHAEKESFLFENLDLIHGFAFPYLYNGLVDKSDTVYFWDGTSDDSPSGEGEVGTGPNDSKDKRFDIRDRINLNYQLIPQFSLNLNNQIQYTNNKPEDKYADRAAGYPITPRPGSLLFSITGLSGELKLFDNRWMTVAGFKHYFFSSEGYETSLYPGPNLFVPPDSVRHNSHNFGGNVASRYKILDWFMLKASYEHGQRMPTGDEIFGNGFEIKTSPDLVPEVSDNIIGGFYLDKSFGSGPTEINIKLESDAFLMYIDDMIRLGGLLVKTYENVDEAKIWGVDGEVQLTLTRYFYTYFNWTYQDIRNDADYVPGTTQSNYLKGKRMPNIPPYFFNWGAEITFFDMFGNWASPTEFALFYDGSHVAEFLYEYEVSENQKKRVLASTTHDIGFQMSFREKRYCLSGSVINITGERAYDLYNQPLPGQVFKLALRGTFY